MESRNKLVHIGNANISVKEYKGQRVVTFKDIDIVHERMKGTAGRNYRDNKKHFIEGEDYFHLTGADLKSLKQTTNFVGSNARELVLLTEQGYLMLVKSFTDDLAWDVQRQLVNNYFTQNDARSMIYQYPVSPAAMDSATNAGRLFERIMRREMAAPYEIAYTVRQLFTQAGIDVPDCVVKFPAYEQIELPLSSIN